MRISARISILLRTFGTVIVAIGLSALFLTHFATPAAAQNLQPSFAPSPSPVSSGYSITNIDDNVERNHHVYTQILLYDVLSAVSCQLAGIDPSNPDQPCLIINPQTGKLGYAPTQQFGGATDKDAQLGGAVGVMSYYVGSMYTPSVSSGEYVSYLSNNFGIVKSANAQAPGTPGAAGAAQIEDCSKSGENIGYGFCGLKPIFKLWTIVRDFAYMLLVIAFIFLGLGVMLRFKVDPRTAMTLQNQIPRVIVAILLITFSYAIAGFMIDIMWTVTYTGINIMTTDIKADTNSKKGIICVEEATGGQSSGVIDRMQFDLTRQEQPQIREVEKPLSEGAGRYLINQPFSFVDSIFANGCLQKGIGTLNEKVTDSFGEIITNIIFNVVGIRPHELDCGVVFGSISDCALGVFVWLVSLVVELVILIALLIALFRLWFELLKTYIILLLFIILGPLWIVMGLIPGRPLGFEKWLRIIFANLAAFPLAAFMIVFARVLMDSVPSQPKPEAVFVPPLIGNPNIEAFSTILGFGAVMLAPTIPGMIKERMKATGNAKYGATIAAGLGIAAGAAAAPGVKAMKALRRKDREGRPVGALANFGHDVGTWARTHSKTVRNIQENKEQRARDRANEIARRRGEKLPMSPSAEEKSKET